MRVRRWRPRREREEGGRGRGTPDQLLRYRFIAHQINREDQLQNVRMRWTLTTNTLLAATVGVLTRFTPQNSFAPDLLKVIPWCGLLMTIAGGLGVGAAQLQIKYLVGKFNELGPVPWVRLFGERWDDPAREERDGRRRWYAASRWFTAFRLGSATPWAGLAGIAAIWIYVLYASHIGHSSTLCQFSQEIITMWTGN